MSQHTFVFEAESCVRLEREATVVPQFTHQLLDQLVEAYGAQTTVIARWEKISDAQLAHYNFRSRSGREKRGFVIFPAIGQVFSEETDSGIEAACFDFVVASSMRRDVECGYLPRVAFRSHCSYPLLQFNLDEEPEPMIRHLLFTGFSGGFFVANGHEIADQPQRTMKFQTFLRQPYVSFCSGLHLNGGFNYEAIAVAVSAMEDENRVQFVPDDITVGRVTNLGYLREEGLFGVDHLAAVRTF